MKAARVFALKWGDGDISVVVARDSAEALALFDTVGDVARNETPPVELTAQEVPHITTFKRNETNSGWRAEMDEELWNTLVDVGLIDAED